MRLVSSLATVLIPSLVLGFKDTSPLLIWSSSPNQAIRDATSQISSGMTLADEVYGALSNIGCDWETIVLVHMDELHQSHLNSITLPSTSADLHIPYLIRPSRQSLDSAVKEWAQTCGADIVESMENPVQGKAVVRLSANKGDEILTDLSTRTPSPDLIILTGTSTSPSLTKRQERPLSSHTVAAAFQTISANSTLNTTAPTGGPLLDRVQLLTTPIITALLITFGLFVPIIGFGVSALAGIQVPPRMMEISKGMVVGKDRKEQ